MSMKVNISPGVGIIKIFKALDYESWFALAEYIDNSISSYETVRSEILKSNPNYSLEIEIDINHVDSNIVIRDNAGGIELNKFQYAFRAAEIPEDTTGLNEFGMGMKTASSWLADRWTVTTSAFKDPVERTIQFNVNEVVTQNIQELEVREESVSPNSHYTVIKLEQLTGNAPSQREVSKIRKHLASIHRKFLRRGDVKIIVNRETLVYEDPEVLKAPLWNNENGPIIEWKKDIDISFGKNKRVTGFVGLLDVMSSSVHNGFSLFRRGRVIEGSGEDLYRPKELSGTLGSHQYKRIFGELELEGFNVDFKKGKFQGDEDFYTLFDLLHDYCDKDELPLIRQGRNYRKPQPKEDRQKVATKGVKEYRENVSNIELQKSITQIINDRHENDSQPKESDENKVSIEKPSLAQISETIKIDDKTWIIELELTDDLSYKEWLTILDEENQEGDIFKLNCRLSLVHPFMSSFGTDDIQPFIRLAFALAISESLALSSGGGPRHVRKNLNKMLNTVLGK